MITYKPCLAFDTLCALAHNNVKCVRDAEPAVQAFMAMIREGLQLPPAVQKLSKVLECHFSLDDIEKMSVGELADIYPQLMANAAALHPSTEFLLKRKDDIAEGLRRMAEYDFEKFWRLHFYDALINFCDVYAKYMETFDLTGLLNDVKIIRQVNKVAQAATLCFAQTNSLAVEKIEDIRVYVSFFSSGTSYMLNINSYVQGYLPEHLKTPDRLMCTLAHELCHGFMSGELARLYQHAYNNDPFLHQTHWFLINCAGSTDEEELVVAIENFIAVRNGLRTLEQAKENIGNHRSLSCMPIAVILFDLLSKEPEIPSDINKWFIQCFESGYVDIGNIKSQADSLFGNFSAKFNETWNSDNPHTAEKCKKYSPLDVQNETT